MASILILYKNRKLCKYNYMIKSKICIWSKILLYLWWNNVHPSHCAQNQYNDIESDFTQPILVRPTARVVMRIIFCAYFSYLRIFAHILIWHKLACQMCQSLCIGAQGYSSLIFHRESNSSNVQWTFNIFMHYLSMHKLFREHQGSHMNVLHKFTLGCVPTDVFRIWDPAKHIRWSFFQK